MIDVLKLIGNAYFQIQCFTYLLRNCALHNSLWIKLIRNLLADVVQYDQVNSSQQRIGGQHNFKSTILCLKTSERKKNFELISSIKINLGEGLFGISPSSFERTRSMLINKSFLN